MQVADDGEAHDARSAPSIERTRAFLHANALAQLAPLLCGADIQPALAHAALSAGLALAQTPEGAQGLTLLTSHLRRAAAQDGALLVPDAAAFAALERLVAGQAAASRGAQGPVATQLQYDDLADDPALQQPTSGNAWACALVAALLDRPPLSDSAVAHLAPVAARSASLSKALLPLLFVLVATTLGADDATSAICQQLTELACVHVLPTTTAATATILHGAAPLDTAASCVTSARIESIELLLQCLSMLRGCAVAARLCRGLNSDYSKSKSGVPAEVKQARHVVSWPMEHWVDIDSLQVLVCNKTVNSCDDCAP